MKQCETLIKQNGTGVRRQVHTLVESRSCGHQSPTTCSSLHPNWVQPRSLRGRPMCVVSDPAEERVRVPGHFSARSGSARSAASKPLGSSCLPIQFSPTRSGLLVPAEPTPKTSSVRASAPSKSCRAMLVFRLALSDRAKHALTVFIFPVEFRE